MNPVLARFGAALLIVILVGPTLVAATCELTCAVASHHQSPPSSTEASCHEHQGTSHGVGVSTANGVLCHESGDLPFAVIDGWLNTVAVSASPAATVGIAESIAARRVAHTHEHSAPFDPRPADRPLRV